MAIATVNPTTGRTEASFEAHTAEDVDARLDRAVSAAKLLRGTTFAERAVWARRAADLLEADLDSLARILTVEMGKPIAAARGEITKSATSLRFYADNAEGFLADVPLDRPGRVGASAAYSRFQPMGPVLAVMPWNYPIWQVIRFAAPALMAGNTGLLKHASNVPQSALYLDTLFERAGFPEGSFQTLLVGSGAVEAIIRDPRVKAVTITGSEGAGRAVARAAGDSIKKSVLELGGSDPFLVLGSADVSAAARMAVTARTSNNGQACINAKRFIVEASVYDAFLAEFTERMTALAIGDPLDEATDIGPLATESGRSDIVELVEDARSKGAEIVAGGTVPIGDGWFFPPTVITGITPEMRLYQEEAFGPVASVYRVADVAEAIALANVTEFGLGSAVWTTDDDEAARVVDELEAGAVFVNGMTVSYSELPFGGVKSSGYGRELAAEGIREFCNLKTVWRA